MQKFLCFYFIFNNKYILSKIAQIVLYQPPVVV